jgi:hypothetical protein
LTAAASGPRRSSARALRTAIFNPHAASTRGSSPWPTTL